jgi:hypothetical protein
VDNEKLAQEAGDNRAGWKRPLWWLGGKLAPVPWVGGKYPRQNIWQRVQGDLALAAKRHRLCLMCGEGFESAKAWDNRVYALISGLAGSDEVGITPSPTFGHPSCILKAVTFCPHLLAYKYPACDSHGRRLDREALKELARLEKTHGK